MGCGAAKSSGVVATEDNAVSYFESRDPILVSDTGAGLTRQAQVVSKYREPMLVEPMPPGSLPEPWLSGNTGFEGCRAPCGGSLIMKHPPRKPQRLEEDQALLALRSPKRKMVSSTARINQKPTIQDVPEEDEEAEEEESEKVTAVV